MDAEKFDKVVLDLLYDELDELTRASAIRHMEQSGRAKALYSELRATREVGAVPLVEPPDDLETRILEAEERIRAGRPLHQRIGSAVSIIASYAMRPQLGMAAVLLLMVGSSLLLLRVKPGEPSPRSVQVTERGVPESDKEVVALVPSPAAPSPVSRDDTAMRGAGRARGADAPRAEAPADKAPQAEASRVASAGPAMRAAPATHAAKDDESDPFATTTTAEEMAGAPAEGAGAPAAVGASGDLAQLDDGTAEKKTTLRDECEITLPRYEAALARAASPIEANRARWGAAECYTRLGRIESARRAFTALLKAPAYADRAKGALEGLPAPAATAVAAAAPAAEPAPPPEAAKPAAPAASAAPPAKAKAAP